MPTPYRGRTVGKRIHGFLNNWNFAVREGLFRSAADVI
jgi:hypothetical protein